MKRDSVTRLKVELGRDAWPVAAWRLGATADMSASNVPGLPYRSFLAGARVDRIFAFGPLPAI